jgi:hypothetical protein
VTSTTPLRLTLAATPRPSREQLRSVLPRPLWSQAIPAGSGPNPAGPLLLSFHGTEFVAACFAWLAGEGPLPVQKAWRDWCEPPAALLAGTGGSAYPTTIARGHPWGLEPEADGSGLDVDGVPAGSPPWLRKLYLPQHDRFTVVVLELICQAAGWPPLDRRRVKEAGLLVRRLRPGSPSGSEQWEDWIAASPRHGRWEAPSAIWEADPGRDPTDRPGLVSQTLALAPTTLAGMGERCVLHGYLPTTSTEQELPQIPGSLESRAAAVALHERARQGLQALAAAVPPAAWVPPAATVLSLLRDTVLGAVPSNDAMDTATVALHGALLGAAGPSDNDPLDLVLAQALRVLIERALTPAQFAADLGGVVISGEDLWGSSTGAASGSSVVVAGLTALRGQRVVEPVGPIPAAVELGQPSDWDVLVRGRLETLLDAWIRGQALPSRDPAASASSPILLTLRDRLLPALVAAALVRARGCRLALAHAMNQAQAVAPEDLNDADPGPPPPGRVSPRARHSLADLGEGLESFLALEDERASRGTLAPWGAYTAPDSAARLRRVNHNLSRLREHYAPLEEQLAGCGTELGSLLQERALRLEAAMGTALDELRAVVGLPLQTPPLPNLLERGLDLLEPPATGLLLLPGIGGIPTRELAAIGHDLLARYPAAAPPPQSEAEALLAARLLRPRFDAHHIYAVQAWVRVSGRRPGEAERVIWSLRSEPFVLAEHHDLLGSQPQTVALPDLPRLLRDLERLGKAGANPFLTLVPPPRSGLESGSGGLDGLRRTWGMGTPLALVAPVLALAGLGLLRSTLPALSRLPGLAWLRQVVIRPPTPDRRP